MSEYASLLTEMGAQILGPPGLRNGKKGQVRRACPEYKGRWPARDPGEKTGSEKKRAPAHKEGAEPVKKIRAKNAAGGRAEKTVRDGTKDPSERKEIRGV